MTTSVQVKLQPVRDIIKSWISEKKFPTNVRGGKEKKKKKADKVGNGEEDTI